MKDVLMLIAVFAVGYLLTMAVVIVMVRLFFPFKTVNRGSATTVDFIKHTRQATRSLARRKVKLANG